MKTSATQKKAKSSGNQTKGTLLSSGLELTLFIIVHVLIFILLFHFVYKIQYTGTGIYFDYASKVLQGSLPYRDFTMEYPPFALFFFILPRLIASTYTSYAVAYQVLVLIFDIIGLCVVYSVARRLGKAPWKMLTIYTLAILAIGPIIAQQYDIFPAVLTLLALYYFWLGKHKTSWALLALGTLTKFYPAVIAPIFLIYYLRNRQYKTIWSRLIICCHLRGDCPAFPYIRIREYTGFDQLSQSEGNSD